ncbi:hypothetical protein GJU39_03470 [Pedobacter petrophilus]|uniref:Lipoprotein n=1 Tax=Pedobacter petrophilus TaxID=1908241 RepID=A0A7K0FU76_9SPHI|nr:hypothetical protein [Pedobacter petrophilus]MRX75138.1 hypothetical protein [Pedobacter petrophilus]
MKNTIALFGLFLITASSCIKDEKTNSNTKETFKSATSNNKYAKVQYESPTPVKNTDVLLYPLRLAQDLESYKREVESNYWNLVFYNVISGTRDLLTSEKVLINNYQIGDSEKGPDNPPSLSDQFIYYDVTDLDDDGDKKLTPKDSRKLYLSSLYGKSFKSIIPKNYRLMSWKLDSKHNLILINLIKGFPNEESESKNEIEYFIYDLKTEKLKAVFDQKFKNDIQKLAEKVL